MSKWRVKLKGSAAKSLKSLDTGTKQRIERFIDQLIETDNPRSHGKALQGKRYAGLWRYRIGDYRLICQIKDGELIILLLEIGHRKDIYK
ncbi:MAG: type II toxin-antitoxin system RelE/ParE family toxin [Methylobacter sp.]|nr:type II toxin-antitoxin system RelE/ParE family toxin [Methylobacter sp.]